MTPYFWRIFLSVWAVVFLSLALTSVVANQLLQPFDTIEKSQVSRQMVELIVRDLRRELASNTDKSVEELARRYYLDQPPMHSVYVIDADNQDVLGRSLPSEVEGLVQASGSLQEAAGRISDRLQVYDEGLSGYKVVGLRSRLPLARVFAKRGVPGVLVAFAVISSAVISYLLARFIAHPVRQLRLAGHRVASGDLSVRVAPHVGSRSDDIAELARDFDLMTRKVDALLQSRQRLLRDVSHELRSPLARLQALLSIQRQTAELSEVQRIDRMDLEIERLNALIGEILDYSRLEAADGVNPHATDLIDLLQTVVDDASLEGEAVNKHIDLHVPEACVVDVDSALVQRAVENVVRNALRHSADGTIVQVTVERDDRGVCIVVDDHGPGVPGDALTKIFEPFYRVDNARKEPSGGGGIGLAIADRSIRLHGGSTWASNRPEGGLRVTLQLPLLPA